MPTLTALFPDMNEDQIADFLSASKIGLAEDWHTGISATEPLQGGRLLVTLKTDVSPANDDPIPLEGMVGDLAVLAGKAPTIYDDKSTQVYPVLTQDALA